MKGTCVRCGTEKPALVSVSHLTPDVSICIARTTCSVARKHANRTAREAGVLTPWQQAEQSNTATCPRCGRNRHKHHMHNPNRTAPQVFICSARPSCTTARRTTARAVRDQTDVGHPVRTQPA